MENDLIKKGFEKLTLGVEPLETRNIKIYLNWGYDNYIKTAYELYPVDQKTGHQEKVMVNYYLKNIERKNIC